MPWRRTLAALAAAGVAASTLLSAGTPPASAVDPSLPVRLTVVAAITAPPSETGLIPADALEQHTSPLGMLTRQLDAMAGRPVAIGVDPMIIASIRVLGSAAPPSALAWLERLASVTNQTFPLAYGDTDLTLATQAGAAAVPEPIAFTELDPALFGGDTAEVGEPVPSPEPTAPATDVPSLDELLAWPWTLTTVGWPRPDTVVSADVGPLAASGLEQLVVSSTNLQRPASASPTAAVGGLTALVADAAVSQALSAAASAPDDASWASAMQAALDAIGASAAEQPGDRATVFATIDRSAPIVGSRLAETLDALGASGSVISTPLTVAASSQPDDAEIVDAPQPADRVAAAGALLAADADDRAFSSVAVDPDAIAGPRRLALLGLLGTAWEPNPTGWTAAAQAYLTASADLLGAVRVEETSQVNFFAEKSAIPIPVTNALNTPVTVFVTLDADTPLLAVEDPRVEMTLPPNSQANALVPVQALSNGRVVLVVSLSSQSGQQVGPSRLVEVNVVAGWEGPVFTALAIVVVLLFAGGIVRTVVRRRRAANME